MTALEMIQKYYPALWCKEQVDELLVNCKITVADYLTVFPVSEENPVTDDMMNLLISWIRWKQFKRKHGNG